MEQQVSAGVPVCLESPHTVYVLLQAGYLKVWPLLADSPAQCLCTVLVYLKQQLQQLISCSTCCRQQHG
jgi:hypothetical protein